jgi:hypothetical protein
VVFIVDDHDVVRKGLRFYLSAHFAVTTVGEAGDVERAEEGVTEHVPDVVLMDLVLLLKPGTVPVEQGEAILHPRIARRLMAEVISPTQPHNPAAELTVRDSQSVSRLHQSGKVIRFPSAAERYAPRIISTDFLPSSALMVSLVRPRT